MSVEFSVRAFNEYTYWQQHDKKILNKINKLFRDIQSNYAKGIGEPEPLKNNLQGYWSRRITKEHRLVYKVKSDRIYVYSCRYHYSK